MRRNHLLRAVTKTVLQGRGVGVFGALGSGTLDDKYCFDDIHLSLKRQPIAVSAGVGHTAVITTDHRVAIFGRPFDLSSIFKIYGIYRFIPLFAKWATRLTMLDQNSAKEVLLSPIFLDDLMKQKVISVSCSGGLTMMLTDTGKVYCLGANNFGQCGIGENKLRYWRPIAPATLPPVIAIDAGLQHCIALCQSGEVYCWGKGKNGQLGTGDLSPINTYPRLVPMKQKCIAIGAGLNHTVALDESGILHLWGKRMSDQLEENTKQTYKGDSTSLLSSLSHSLRLSDLLCLSQLVCLSA
jgi:alpha-tubulin suppressor-like RCC1 family protein